MFYFKPQKRYNEAEFQDMTCVFHFNTCTPNGQFALYPWQHNGGVREIDYVTTLLSSINSVLVKLSIMETKKVQK